MMSTSMNRSRLGTPGRASTEPLATRVVAALSLVVERLMDWQERSAQRHRLMGLDDRMLRDIGITRTDVMREYHKAPWRL